MPLTIFRPMLAPVIAGGLVIKAGMDGFNKSVILGALGYTMRLIENDKAYLMLFESIGDTLFLTAN